MAPFFQARVEHRGQAEFYQTPPADPATEWRLEAPGLPVLFRQKQKVERNAPACRHPPTVSPDSQYDAEALARAFAPYIAAVKREDLG